MSYDPGKKTVDFDCTIISDGTGMYDDIQTAFTAVGANKSYLIRGSFTAASSITVPAGAYLVIQKATVTLTNASFTLGGNDGITAIGELTLTGAGLDTTRELFNTGAAANDNFMSGLLINLVPTGNGLTKGSSADIAHCVLNGARNYFNFKMHDIAYNLSEGGGLLLQMIVTTAFINGELKYFFDTVANAGTDNLLCNTMNNASHYNTIYMNIESCTGGTPVPLTLNGDYNCVVGVNRGSGTIGTTGTGNDLYVAV